MKRSKKCLKMCSTVIFLTVSLGLLFRSKCTNIVSSQGIVNQKLERSIFDDENFFGIQCHGDDAVDDCPYLELETISGGPK